MIETPDLILLAAIGAGLLIVVAVAWLVVAAAWWTTHTGRKCEDCKHFDWWMEYGNMLGDCNNSSAYDFINQLVADCYDADPAHAGCPYYKAAAIKTYKAGTVEVLTDEQSEELPEHMTVDEPQPADVLSADMPGPDDPRWNENRPEPQFDGRDLSYTE